MVYNVVMKTNTIQLAVVGGGAAGLMLACETSKQNISIAVFERGERVGKKLSATGNGQGNITNLHASNERYFSSTAAGEEKAKHIIQVYDESKLKAFFEDLGVLLTADARGRVYPASKQASSLTDALRFTLSARNVPIYTNAQIVRIEKQKDVFCLTAKTADGEEKFYAQNVALCTGGKAAKNFGTDGSAYALAQAFGHTLTPLYPSLVQCKTDAKECKTLKGIRVADGVLTATTKKETIRVQGDILFTDYGVSGDAVFRLSCFFADQLQNGGVTLSIDFLPDVSEQTLYQTLVQKQRKYPALPTEELLFGIVNNQVGRAVMRRAGGDLQKAVRYIKAFTMNATGTLGFDYAQVTKGGIPLTETDDHLQSAFANGFYFAGEILDVDGQCGGFNLQWAFASAQTVATAILEKTRGQV